MPQGIHTPVACLLLGISLLPPLQRHLLQRRFGTSVQGWGLQGALAPCCQEARRLVSKIGAACSTHQATNRTRKICVIKADAARAAEGHGLWAPSVQNATQCKALHTHLTALHSHTHTHTHTNLLQAR